MGCNHDTHPHSLAFIVIQHITAMCVGKGSLQIIFYNRNEINFTKSINSLKRCLQRNQGAKTDLIR